MAQQKQKRHGNTRNKVTVAGRRGYSKLAETDGTYFLKLVVIVLLGTFWLKFQTPVTWLGFPFNALPAGLLLGLLLVSLYEKLQADRKIWYAILIVVTIITYFDPAGIVI